MEFKKSKTVPISPTEEMIEAGRKALIEEKQLLWSDTCKKVYEAMLHAAPMYEAEVGAVSESVVLVEEAAKAIYPLLPGDEQGSPVDHPWREGGNSNMQDLARRMARAALARNKL